MNLESNRSMSSLWFRFSNDCRKRSSIEALPMTILLALPSYSVAVYANLIMEEDEKDESHSRVRS